MTKDIKLMTELLNTDIKDKIYFINNYNITGKIVQLLMVFIYIIYLL